MKSNGGSVFPTIQSETGDYGTVLYAMQNPGLTVRDYFAGMALAGYVVAVSGGRYPTPEEAANFSFEIADAMIAKREKFNE